MTEIPALPEELERKASGAIIHAAERLDRGELTAQEFWALVDGIYDTVSGLVPKALMDWILAFRKAKLERFTERRVFGRPPAPAVVVLRRIVGAFNFDMLVYDLVDGTCKTRQNDFSKAHTPARDAAQGLEKLADSLIEKGWIEL